MKCDCINRSILNGIRESILFSFGLSSPSGHKIYKEPRIKLFKKVNKSVLSHISFYLEDDDYKTVDFHNEMITFTCLTLKIYYLFLYRFQMNLNMIRPKNQTEDLLLSITKNCETLIRQTHRKPGETLEYKMIKARETFHFNPPIQGKGDWMIGLVDLEVYNSIFNITEEKNKFELYKFPDEKDGGVSYEKVRDEIERDLDISDITATDIQDEILAPIIIKEYREQVTKRMKDVGYTNIVAGYVSPMFQDFESYLRTEVDLIEDDINLVLDEYNSSFINNELYPGIYF